MIALFILSLSFLAFSILFLFSRKKGAVQNRRSVTGCEIARYILDANGSGWMAVDILDQQAGYSHLMGREIYLEREIYEGKNLRAIARAARQVIFDGNLQPAVLPSEWTSRLRQPLKGLTFLAWIFLFLSFCHPALVLLKAPALFTLSVIFFLGILNLTAERDASQKAFLFLKQSRYFELDELIQLKEILAFLRFEGLSRMYQVPFDSMKILFRKRGKSLYGV